MLIYVFLGLMVVAVVALGFQFSRYEGTLQDE
jgi:hypothetical protein